MEQLRELVTACNIYMTNKDKATQLPNRQLLLNIAQYITYILKVSKFSFILQFRSDYDFIFIGSYSN